MREFENIQNGKKNVYILRYYLPCEPICDEAFMQRRSEALIAYCVKNKIEAVMLYVDLNPYWYYGADTIEHTKYYAEQMQSTICELEKHGISYQLNYQNLFGSWDGGADLRYINDWENYVDEKGRESYGCACCIGERFRKVAGEKLKIWAATKPDVIWIDDDIRFHNHRTAIRDVWAGKLPFEPLDFGCFCDKHIALFNETYNLRCTREELVSGIKDGEKSHGLREKWLNFSAEVAAELAGWIEETVHSVSPETRVAVMTSLPDVHSVEGRNWQSFLSRLSGAYTPILRPTFGPYTESNPRDFIQSYLCLEQLKANIKAQYHHDFVFCPEIENTRFTRWSKSVAATGYQLLLSAFSGCKGVTLSLFDLEGCILEEEPEFAELLNDRRGFADAMAQRNMWELDNRGIALITAPNRVSDAVRGSSVTDMYQLSQGRLWDAVLSLMGIPCRYYTPEQAENCSCCALDAYTAGLLHDEELTRLLSGGVLLDAGAAAYLSERGFSEYLGVTVGERMPCIAAVEAFDFLKRTDGSEVRLPLRADGGKWNHINLCGAEQISRIVTPYGTEYPSIVRFKNSLGGTVYTFAQNGAFGDGFFSTYRVSLLKDICRELSKESLVLTNNPGYALTAVKKEHNTYFVFAANLSADTIKDMQITVPGQIKRAKWIDMYGISHEAEFSGNRMSCNGANMNLYNCLMGEIEVQ